MFYFNALNFVSGFLEIGFVLFGYKEYGVLGAMTGALLYQVGNLAPNPIDMGKKLSWFMLSIGLAFEIAGLYYPAFFYAGIPFFTLVLQSLRSELKESDACKHLGKIGKRIFRVLGFSLGFAMNSEAAILCCLVIMIVLLRSKKSHRTSFNVPVFNRYDGILVLHEVHYFVYCYSMLIFICNFFNAESWGIHMSSALFALSWIPYVFVPNVYKNPRVLGKLGFKNAFLLGHGILIVILALLYFTLSQKMMACIFPWSALVIWFLTGIGGTTEFCIEELDKNNGSYVKGNHNSAENLGHILGVIFCTIFYVVTNNLLVSVIVAGGVAFLAFLSMLFFVKEK